MKLQDRVVAVTGGSQGIGRAIAAAALAHGAKVAIMGRSQEKGDKALAEFDAGDRAAFFAGDVTHQADVEGFIEDVVAEFGRIDVLVNNAGGAQDLRPIVDLTDEEWNLVINWNLNANFWATRRALRHMLPNKWGRIINISSIEGKQGKEVFTPYSAVKHAINGMTKSIAREVGTQGITVNSICPGLVVTDIVKEFGPAIAETMGMTFEEYIAFFTKDSAIKRANTVEEVAAMAMLLCSEEGAGITGAQLSVDGGTTMY